MRSFAELTITRLRVAGLCLMVALTVSVSQTHSQPAPPAWRSGLHVNHALVGQIWWAAESRFISRDELLGQLSAADVLLLGEKHDNPDHHTLRLELLQSLLATDRPSLLVMEMMAQTQQPAIDTLSAGNPPPETDAWPQLLTWDEGWTWPYYQPVISLALQRNARLMAGNISTDQMMQIYRSESTETATLLNPGQQAKLADEIHASHCGMLPESQIPAMVRVQQARDLQMAKALMSPGQFNQRILLAGNYHVRRDLSVPNYLAHASPDTPASENQRLITLAFLEVDPALATADEYLADAAGQTVYDLIWFTPAVRADDYCADLTPE